MNAVRSAVSIPVSVSAAGAAIRVRIPKSWSCKLFSLRRSLHKVSKGSTGTAGLSEIREQVRTADVRRVQRFVSTSSSEGGQLAVTENSESPVAPDAPAADDSVLVEALDIRVGRIVKVWKHPEADSLYVEEVDVGEPTGPRTICSGLVPFMAQEELENRAVLVLANLKPRNMRGVKSNGMLLAASDASHEKVELLTPPDEAQAGERVWFGEEGEGGAQSEAASPNQLAKKKVWEAVQPLLKTDSEGVANFKGRPMRGEGGVVRSKSLFNGNIS